MLAVCTLICTAVYAGGKSWYTTEKLAPEWKTGRSAQILDQQSAAALQEILKKNRAIWEKEKVRHDNSYSYTRSFQSWVGFGHSTKIKVAKGIVSERSVREYDREQKTTASFTEHTDKISTQGGGSPAKTMEELYEECAQTCLKQDSETNVLSLEFSAPGVLTGCSWRAKGCADDCTQGLSGISFTWEKEYQTVKNPSYGQVLIPFEDKNGLWGYKDNAGKIIISPRYFAAGEFSEHGIAPVGDKSGWKYIDTSGKTVIVPFIFDNGPDYFSEGLARFAENGKMGFFDETGKIIIPAQFDFVFPFSEGLAEFCNGCSKVYAGEHYTMEGGQWGKIDRWGKIVIPAGKRVQ
jgi:hypothetical protein